MLRSVMLILLAVSCLRLSAQGPEGTWVMAYVRAKQPIYTMVDNEGSFELADEIPQDSTYLFSPGLMAIYFDDKITSYSWEGEERFSQSIVEDSIYLFGQRDTLFGVFTDKKLILSSTLDDRPTEYHFDPLEEEDYESPELLGYSWKARVEAHPFDKNLLRFSLSPNSAEYTFKPLNLGPLKAFEYELPATSPDVSDQEYGIVYLFQTRRNRVEGVFYPARDDSGAPLRKELRLTGK